MSNKSRFAFFETASGCITVIAGIATIIGVVFTVLYPLGLLPIQPSTPTTVALQPTSTLTATSTRALATPSAVAPRSTNPVTEAVPSVTPTVLVAPGVYVSGIRLDPTKPRREQPVTFDVAFLNTTGSVQHYRWLVKIFEPGMLNSSGETTAVESDLPPGTSEFPSAKNWKLGGGGDCAQLVARTFFVDQSQKAVEFPKLDRSGSSSLGFQICP